MKINIMGEVKQNVERVKVSFEIITNIFYSEKVKNSIFTVESRKTGKDYTFKVKKNSFKGNKYTHVYVEVGYMEFKYLGYYYKGNIVCKGSVVNCPTAKAISWIFETIENGNYDKLNSGVNFYHTGNCCKCGRVLTDVESIKIGLGPHCRTN